jgi:outer membrane protein assembly factor BamD
MTWKIGRGALLLAAVCACAGGKDNIDITKPVTGAEASNAAIAYNKALQEKKDQNYLEATRLLEYVRTNFPYSQYAALSELAIADMSFDRDDWTAAATQYQDFVKSHPSHPKADYAAFRVGLAYFQDRPSDFFLLPPSYEKDQTPVRQALEALNRFVNAYPKSEFVTKARAMIGDCRELLAQHERYVAGFYVKHEQWRGAAQRFTVLADVYGDLREGRERADALWDAAHAWQKAKDPGDERKTLQRLLQEAPQDPRAKLAVQRIAEIPANAPVTSPLDQQQPPLDSPAPPAAPATTPNPATAPNPTTPPSTPPLSPGGG